jgi:hypothetical protein
MSAIAESDAKKLLRRFSGPKPLRSTFTASRGLLRRHYPPARARGSRFKLFLTTKEGWDPNNPHAISLAGDMIKLVTSLANVGGDHALGPQNGFDYKETLDLTGPVRQATIDVCYPSLSSLPINTSK